MGNGEVTGVLEESPMQRSKEENVKVQEKGGSWANTRCKMDTERMRKGWIKNRAE